jgi:hypothetical protein
VVEVPLGKAGKGLRGDIPAAPRLAAEHRTAEEAQAEDSQELLRLY